METPIPMILLALDAKVQWVRMSNGVGEPEDPGAKVKRVLRAFGK